MYHYNPQPSLSQAPSYDFKWRAATPAPADALPVSDVRVTRITQLVGVTKDPAGSSAASPNPNRTSATTSRGPSAATNLCLSVVSYHSCSLKKQCFSIETPACWYCVPVFNRLTFHAKQCKDSMCPPWVILVFISSWQVKRLHWKWIQMRSF